MQEKTEKAWDSRKKCAQTAKPHKMPFDCEKNIKTWKTSPEMTNFCRSTEHPQKHQLQLISNWGSFWLPTAPEQSLIVKRIHWKRASSSALEHCGRFYLSAREKVKKWRRKFRFIWKLCSFNIFLLHLNVVCLFPRTIFLPLVRPETGAKKKCREKTLGYGEIFLFSKLSLCSVDFLPLQTTREFLIKKL